MAQTAMQLYSLYDVDESIEAVLERVAETRFDAVEFANIRTIKDNTDSIADKLEQTGLDVIGTHYGLGTTSLEDHLDDVADHFEAIGSNDLVLGFYDKSMFDDPMYFQSEKVLDRVANRLDAIGDRLADRGMKFHYHNHGSEMVEINGKTGLERLVEGTDNVNFQLDTGWVGASGYDPVAFIDQYAERMPLVHVRDYKDGSTTELGDGELDLEGVLNSADENGVEWIIYEYTGRRDSFATLENADRVLFETIS